MIRCNQFGQHTRLGNWLFVYAAIVSVAEATGHEVEMPAGYFLWKYLKNPPKLTTDVACDIHYSAPSPRFSDEGKAEMYKFFSDNRDKTINVDLTCFFQSEKWFDRDVTIEKLAISDAAKNDVISAYPELSGCENIVGIGIRRGDFVGHPAFYQIPEDWYMETMAKWQEWRPESKIVVFSDDVEWCRKKYAGIQVYYPRPNLTHLHGPTYHLDPMEQFILGTFCQIFVGGSSTFSWWQMWYVRNFNDGFVCHSGKNISEELEYKYGNKDYYPEGWHLAEPI